MKGQENRVDREMGGERGRGRGSDSGQGANTHMEANRRVSGEGRVLLHAMQTREPGHTARPTVPDSN